MRRALVIVPFPLDAQGVANRRLQLKSVKLGPDIAFDFRPVKASCTSFMSDHDWIFMDAGCFEAGVTAQEEGYDAVVIDSMSDSGAAALRSVLDIPVIAPGRSSLLFAMMLGTKFGILAMTEVGAFSHHKWVAERQLTPFLAAVEPIGAETDVAKLMTGKEDRVFPLMKAAAERAIKKGAEVIVLGSTTMHQAGTWLNKNVSVPVVNPGPLTYKLVETALALDLTHSRKAFPRPTAPKLGMLHAMLDAAKAYERKGGAKKAKTRR
ncbi:MAG: hydrogenase expression protein HupH [Alphaproteobacteria bacterium]|nr:hydrogenase expression protein HupH [Alphaproteobacteria bacterium]